MSGVRARPFERDETWSANCMECAVALRDTKTDERPSHLFGPLAVTSV